MHDLLLAATVTGVVAEWTASSRLAFHTFIVAGAVVLSKPMAFFSAWENAHIVYRIMR